MEDDDAMVEVCVWRELWVGLVGRAFVCCCVVSWWGFDVVWRGPHARWLALAMMLAAKEEGRKPPSVR